MARPLKMYMRGKSVRMLQETLKRLGYPMEDQPSIFGVSTRDAVKNFQAQKKLKPTGIVDDELLNLMRTGHNVADMDAAQPPKKREPITVTTTPVDQDRLEALVRLMIAKGMINEAELAEEMTKSPPKKASQLPMG